MIARYNADGEQRFVVQTIDGMLTPKIVKIGESQTIKPDSLQAQSVLSMSIRGNELYVLSGARSDGAGSAGGQVMDVYDKQDGNYLFSLKLPIACREAIVREDNLYMLGDNGVTIWRFRQSALAESSLAHSSTRLIDY